MCYDSYTYRRHIDLLQVQDLHRWWYRVRCGKGKMAVIGKPLEEIVRDPRYKVANN